MGSEQANATLIQYYFLAKKLLETSFFRYISCGESRRYAAFLLIWDKFEMLYLQAERFKSAFPQKTNALETNAL